MEWSHLSNKGKCRRLTDAYRALRHNVDVQQDTLCLEIPVCVENYKKTKKIEELERARHNIFVLCEKYDLTVFTLLR